MSSKVKPYKINFFRDIMNRERSNLNQFKYNIQYRASNKIFSINHKASKNNKNIYTESNFYPNIINKNETKFCFNKNTKSINDLNKKKDIKENDIQFPYLCNMRQSKTIKHDSKKDFNEIIINPSSYRNEFVIDINEEENYNFEKNSKPKKSITKKIENNNNIKFLKKTKEKINLDEIINMNKKNSIINNGVNEKIINIRMKENKNNRNKTMVYYSNSNSNIFKTKKEGLNFVLSNFSCYQHDFLNLKNIMNKYDEEDAKNRNKTLFGKGRKLYFNQKNNKNEDIFYRSKYFLPTYGYGLLNKKI